MAEMLSPGVYVNELDYSQYAAEVSSCIVGMVGEARRGPVGVPTLITSQKEMISVFGEPKSGCYGVYSALAFLTEGDQLYYTRVVRGGEKAHAGVVGTNKISVEANVIGDALNGYVVEISDPADDLFTITVYESKDKTTPLETYSNCSLDAGENYVLTKINGVSPYISVKINPSGTVKATLELAGGSGISAKSATAGSDTDLITFSTLYPDSTLNGGKIVISDMYQGEYFDVTVKDIAGNVVETWASLTLDETSDRFVELFINKNSKRIIADVKTGSNIDFKAGDLIIGGGDDGIEGISSFDIIGADTGKGIDSFSNPETVDINVFTVPGYYDSAVVSAATEMCEKRADCIYIIDPPFGISPATAIAWSNGNSSYGTYVMNSSYSAVYWPWVKISDSYTKKDIWLPPSGFVAAQYAYNDKVGAPWLAPAGLNRGKMTKPIAIEHSPTQGERDAMYGNRNVVNAIVNYLGDGIVIWGQKTTQRAPTALDRVNVRRLLNYLKKTISLSTRYFVFEQNNQATWDRWTNMVEPILRQVKERSGLNDYLIEINPTVWEIENNIMPATIKVKPTKSAEFIPIDFMIMPQSASFDV